MHASKIISFLALAASVIALPAPVADDQGVVIVTELVTKYVTAGVPEATPAPSPVADNGDSGKQAQATPTAAAATTAAASAAASTGTGSTGTGYMAIVNKWRAVLGLSDLTESDKLQSNALKTTTDSAGSMVHELNPGSSAQVLGPGQCGDMNAFEKVFVGGWLCEKPNMAGLAQSSGCSDFGAGWAQSGETGHADILTSGSYSNIGCACADGIWGCDLS